MKDKIRKYRTNTLTRDELSDLRKRLESLSDDDIANAIHEDWQEFEPPVTQNETETENRVWNNIMQGADSSEKKKSGRAFRILMRVAVIAIVVLLSGLCIYFFDINHKMGLQVFHAVTAQGERASIILPDNSRVELNSSSEMEYRVADFSDDIRKINFKGEGYFDITSNPQRPFVIESGRLEVTVKGTVFNFSARPYEEKAVLSLIQGAVTLTDTQTDKSVELHPDEKATLDYATGDITVSPIVTNDNVLSWKRGRLSFENASYNEVMTQLHKYYGNQVNLNSDENHSERFTGVIPLNDLEVALDIVSTTFR